MYSLDVIISVGYRVKSQRGAEFRRWANSVLKDNILQGSAVILNHIRYTLKQNYTYAIVN
ncbi:MAG: virulence RhuM family protein [Mogibacterium sp.]|nr:virulence RhuM family protein [Mogibacterium sp.]